MRSLERRAGMVWAGVAAIVTAVWWAGCSQTRPPVADQRPAEVDRSPVVFVPGVTGVSLYDETSSRSVWGTGKDLMRPHDRGRATAVPIEPHSAGPRLEPGGAILSMKLFGIYRVRIYQQLVDLFQTNGYRLGNLESPRPDDDFFLFAYDWRQDNVSSAQLLAERLEGVRRLRDVDRLRVTLICQSNGAHVCRYFTKYGALDLADAEAGAQRRPAGVEVDKLVLVGASNGGSIRVLRELNRGRKYLRIIGRYWAPETLFTFRSLFQDLPVYTDDLFVDDRGEPMAVDLFTAASWQRYGWSIYGRETRMKLERHPLPAWFGNEIGRSSYLQHVLERALRFHGLLRRDAPVLGSPWLFLIKNTHQQTPSRAVLVGKKGSWRTLFADDREVQRRPELSAVVSVPGDGHATAASQGWLSAQEREWIEWEPLEVESGHRRVILHPSTQRYLLEILAADGDVGR